MKSSDTDDDDEMRFLSLQLSRITLSKEEYRVATFSDVTESMKAQRVEANARMVHFLTSNITHEMLTPLKCIMSFSKSLQKELKHSDRRQEAELIFVTAKLILSQTKMLLDRDMIVNDMFTLANEVVPINRIVADAVYIMNQLASVKSIKIKLKLLLEEFMISVDPIRLQQVIINLLSNAIKFSQPNDTILVSIKRVDIDDQYNF